MAFPTCSNPLIVQSPFIGRARLHTTQSLCVRITLSHSSLPSSPRLAHRKIAGPCFLPQNLVAPLPALGKKGGAVTADSPCRCTAENRDCRARSSLHVGDRYHIASKRSCCSTSARMSVFSSLASFLLFFVSLSGGPIEDDRSLEEGRAQHAGRVRSMDAVYLRSMRIHIWDSGVLSYISSR